MTPRTSSHHFDWQMPFASWVRLMASRALDAGGELDLVTRISGQDQSVLELQVNNATGLTVKFLPQSASVRAILA
jgi:hypothetical protein